MHLIGCTTWGGKHTCDQPGINSASDELWEGFRQSQANNVRSVQYMGSSHSQSAAMLICVRLAEAMRVGCEDGSKSALALVVSGEWCIRLLFALLT